MKKAVSSLDLCMVNSSPKINCRVYSFFCCSNPFQRMLQPSISAACLLTASYVAAITCSENLAVMDRGLSYPYTHNIHSF